jgi:SEC-C motif-containing protein
MLYHKGAKPANALLLMKSRYAAYAVGEYRYILKTTHPHNPSYQEESKAWGEDIKQFCSETEFLALEIIDHEPGEEESFVTFKARLSSGELIEKSRFLKEEGRWLYVDGEFV